MTDGGLRPLRAAVGAWRPGQSIANDPLFAIASGWPGIVGPDVAAHSAPLEISGKTLVIATKSSAWSQQLSFLGPTILAGVRALASGADVERLAFRAGTLRTRPGVPTRAMPVERRSKRKTGADFAEPAVDLRAAFERLRDRMRAPGPAATACETCGAPVASGAARCAPCAGRAATERAVNLERIIYMAPWLSLAELRAQLPDLSGSEFEHARRRLLQRWWLLLERTRRAGRVSPSGVERQVASSYVLLQSRLTPDLVSSAVVRNLLGDELDALLWPNARRAPGVGPTDTLVE
jgi:hypothetical protein